MSLLPSVLMLVAGILMLGLGASWLVDGSSRIALRLGIAPMVVGITIVGFGTSMPELLVSVLAAWRGSGGLSLGNAVGSNVMNLMLVLGVAATLSPIQVVGGRRTLQRDLFFGLLPAVVILVLAWNGHIGRGVAAALIGLFCVFMATCLLGARNTADIPTSASGSVLRHLAVATVGIVLLVGGAELMVRGGVNLAERFGISDAVIGLTIVAFGTSLPELATSVIAALKGQAEISVGNILGSNVFNLGLIVGTAFSIRPGSVPVFVIRHDIPFLMLATALVGFAFLRDGQISRREGVVMLILFAGYMGFVTWRTFYLGG